MTRNPSKEESAYLDQVRRAWNCGIGTHMELMTHRGLFDFGAGREPEEAIHEGLWLHEPATTEAEYEPTSATSSPRESERAFGSQDSRGPAAVARRARDGTPS